jgi:hypothetical protein
MFRARLGALLVLTVLAACAERPVPVASLPPSKPAAPRAFVETPPPADIPNPPTPVLKPGSDMSGAESEGLYAQASPKGPPGEQSVPEATASTGGEASSPPLTDAAHLVGLSQSDAANILGPPAERKDLPPAQVWTYHSDLCDLTLFFYPEVGGSAFRALTYEIADRGANDATHTACLASLAKPRAG